MRRAEFCLNALRAMAASVCAMLLLQARDGARFSGTIQEIGAQIRVSYVVALDLGSRREMQRDVAAFSSEDQAIGWLQSQAAARGFEHFSLESRPALSARTVSPRPYQVVETGGESRVRLQAQKGLARSGDPAEPPFRQPG